MLINNSNQVKEFNSINLDLLARNEYGDKSFAVIYSKLAQIYVWIKETVEILKHHEVDNTIAYQFLGYVERFNKIAQLIQSYKIEQDARSFSSRNNIIQLTETYHSGIVTGSEFNANNSQTVVNNFLTIKNTIENAAKIDVRKEYEQLKGISEDLLKKREQADSLLNLLQQKGTEKTFENYALIFDQEATRHSQFNWTTKKFGAAEKWLVTSSLLTLGFVVFIAFLNRIFEIDYRKAVPEVTVLLITRLIIISLFIYVISFSFKQYSVHKHLSTLNLHRRNTLNSYELFIKSINADDTTTKNALMIEVAKAIYESGATGYISGKESETSPSIIEFTRYLNQGK